MSGPKKPPNTPLSKALWKDLNPVGPVEEMLAVEIVRAAWRLHRCAAAEAEDGANPATQASVDRARASAHASMHRLINDLRQFQSDRWLRAEVLREGFNEAYIGIADAHRVIKGLLDDNCLKSKQFKPNYSAKGDRPPRSRRRSLPWRRRSPPRAWHMTPWLLAHSPRPPFNPFPETPLALAILA